MPPLPARAPVVGHNPVVDAASAAINGESLWPRLAGLSLVIEACEYERLHAVFAY